MPLDELSEIRGKFVWQGKYGWFIYINKDSNDYDWFTIAHIYKNKSGEARWAKNQIPDRTLATYNSRKTLNKQISCRAEAKFVDNLIFALSEIRNLIKTDEQEAEMPTETAGVIDKTRESVDKKVIQDFADASSDFHDD